MKTIAKKGEKVIITDFGKAVSAVGQFTLNKPYFLSKDLNEANGFETESDDGYRLNGYAQAFEIGMEFKKVE